MPTAEICLRAPPGPASTASSAPTAAVPRASPRPLPRPSPGAAPAPLLQLDGVTLGHGSGAGAVRATHQVSFDVHRGDRFVLLGASGCGKSSLLKAVAGFLPPQQGTIRLDGAPVTAPGPDRIVVFQEFDQLPPWKTLLANVMFPLLAARRCGRAEARARALAALARVGLAEAVHRRPHQLSGGMKQRAAIARALAMEPRVLLMDEPFAALDPQTRQRMQDQLLALWDDLRFTLLFVTHSIDEALLVGSRVLVLSPRPGRVRAELNAHQFGRGDTASPAFRAQAERLRGLLFEDLAQASVGASVPVDASAGTGVAA